MKISTNLQTRCHVMHLNNLCTHYLENSTNIQAREKKTSGIRDAVDHVLPDLEIPKDWRLLLSRKENKLNLVLFLSSGDTQLHENKHLYLGRGLEEKAHYRSVMFLHPLGWVGLMINYVFLFVYVYDTLQNLNVWCVLCIFLK